MPHDGVEVQEGDHDVDVADFLPAAHQARYQRAQLRDLLDGLGQAQQAQQAQRGGGGAVRQEGCAEDDGGHVEEVPAPRGVRESLFFAVLLAYRKSRPARVQPARMSRYYAERIGLLATRCSTIQLKGQTTVVGLFSGTCA